tara:strand:- start:6012 stop:6428 length:417 start_codon:yes stop_codon:yes gene_type:complete
LTLSNTGKKECEFCGVSYTPRNSQGKTQKYCSRRCKDKVQWCKDKARGSLRTKKGGYPRATILRLWMKAKAEDLTAPCHYCKKRLDPDHFCIEHKIPLRNLNSDNYKDEDNLVISCNECNQKKGTMPYEKFIKNLKNE